MTEHRRPPACHYDRQQGGRVTTEHRDDCEHPDTHRGCSPCTAPHCAICGREHATNAQPQTCPKCQGKTDQDLTELAGAYVELATEALDGGGDGRLVAAAPIPGGNAQILRGPTVPTPALKFTRTLVEDHHHNDPIPALAVLAQWEDLYRAFLGHTHQTETPDKAKWGQQVTGPRRASVSSAIAYLRSQLPYIAQRTDGPDYLAFTRQVRDLRAQLERALHNEQDPEHGVECFECGDTLERRWRRATPCKHDTPARAELRRWARLGYPEALSVIDIRLAYLPCGACDQGGITDPSAGQSWECPGCRKEYDPGEYANAVRRDLLTGGPDRDGWTHIAMAAEAITMITGVTFGPDRIRRWMDRNQVAAVCRWRAETRNGVLVGTQNGIRLVLWTDVRDRAAESIRRAELLELERRREALQEERLRAAVARGDDADAAGARLGIHPARVKKFEAKWAAEARREAREATLRHAN